MPSFVPLGKQRQAPQRRPENRRQEERQVLPGLRTPGRLPARSLEAELEWGQGRGAGGLGRWGLEGWRWIPGEQAEGKWRRKRGRRRKEEGRKGGRPEWGEAGGEERRKWTGVRGGGREAGGRAALGLRPAAGALAEVPVDKWLILVPIGCEGPMRGWSVPPSEGSVLSCHSAWSQH